MGNIGQFRHNLQPAPARGANVVIRTDRGVELGQVLTVVTEDACMGCLTPNRLEEHIKANGPDYPFRRDGKVLRLANPQDLIDQRHLNSSARDERKFCAQEIKDMKLDMKLVAVEHLLGGERIIFYFLAEHRVDFRDLVHKLASQYHTRIEMRQVGARDEARLVGDYERCGQECCCKQFLKGLQPVSMRMAKTQKATLDPSKISGRCGRLMCCLRYEDQCYRDLKKCLPHKNIWVKTAEQIGRVTGTQILTQLVQVQLPDGTRGVFANEDIIERNVDPPEAPPTPSARAPRQADRKGDRKGDQGRRQQGSASPKRQSKTTAEQQTTKPPRKPKPQSKPTPAPKPEPRASAEALDPGWGALLGDGITEKDSAATVPPPEDAQTPATSPDVDEAQESPEPQTAGDTAPQTSDTTQPQARSTGEKSDEQTPQTGKKRRKRRRRRGRRSKGKQQGS
jgi:cell fate regulator YaaT (PSP1 superfamily)